MILDGQSDFNGESHTTFLELQKDLLPQEKLARYFFEQYPLCVTNLDARIKWHLMHFQADVLDSEIENVMGRALWVRMWPWACVECQIGVGNYTIDFLVTYTAKQRKAIVECDGKKWHPEPDKDRDECLKTQLSGRVFHFLGADIYDDPWKLVEEVAHYLTS